MVGRMKDIPTEIVSLELLNGSKMIEWFTKHKIYVGITFISNRF